MEILFFFTRGGWHVNQIKQEAKKRKIRLKSVRLSDLNNIGNKINKTGDVIIWFSSDLKKLDRKFTFFSLIKNRAIMNPDCLKHPFLTRKLFQQKYLEKYSDLNCIPTFVFRSKKELLKSYRQYGLRFPFIQKPNLGSQGENISILNSEADIKKLNIDVFQYIYQNFIPNDGDYRIFVVGGKVLGAIKRIAKEGSFLNNISKGGTAKQVVDPKIMNILEKIALAATSIFDLSICGVDVIYNKLENKYHLMELNTNPQWEGFQKATGINVAHEIINYCVSLHDRKTKNVPVLVKEYFDSNYEYLGNQQFHYASRMYLWTRKKNYKNRLESLRDGYLGNNDEELTRKLKKALNHKMNWKELIAGDARKKYLEKYKNLYPYNRLFFKCLFAETIYEANIRPSIRRLVSDDNFLKLKASLEKDGKSIAALSTFAVNYFYGLAYYFNDPSLVSPPLFLEIFDKNYSVNKKNIELNVYLLTHAIIGASNFYNRKISDPTGIYLEMLKKLEKIIKGTYFQLALDVKFEFLVCCKLCDYRSEIEILIKEEAKKSLADNGNFLISRLSSSADRTSKNLLDAEHRNVLYLMANMDYSER